MAKQVTIINLYDEWLDTNSLIEIIIGVYEINHIVRYGEDSKGVKYNLILDKETSMLLEFLCNAWSSKIRATAFKSALEEWISTQQVPYHVIPKKEYEKYVGENYFL